MRLSVQEAPFDLGAESAGFAGSLAGAGAVVTFTGIVRGDGGLTAMEIEHYPGMTERALADIEAEAQRRWPLSASLIIHRYGQLAPGEDIVLVIAASAHRDAAFDACRFLIDWLKTKAPFWKLEEGDSGAHWVEAQESDEAAAARWQDGRG